MMKDCLEEMNDKKISLALSALFVQLNAELHFCQVAFIRLGNITVVDKYPQRRFLTF